MALRKSGYWCCFESYSKVARFKNVYLWISWNGYYEIDTKSIFMKIYDMSMKEIDARMYFSENFELDFGGSLTKWVLDKDGLKMSKLIVGVRRALTSGESIVGLRRALVSIVGKSGRRRHFN